VQHPGGVTNATRIEGHLDNLLFDRRRLPRVAIVQQESATGTALLAAAVPLLALAGLAMAHNIRTVWLIPSFPEILLDISQNPARAMGDR
jgi:hypothetical protein